MRHLPVLLKLVLVLACAAIAYPSSLKAQLLPTVTLSPDPLEFDEVRVGGSKSLAMTATRGAGSIPVLIFAVRLGNTVDFRMDSDQCSGRTLSSPGESCAMQIGFVPGARGQYSTTISLLSLSYDIIDSAIVEGIGVEPAVTLSVTEIDFKDQTVNTSSLPHHVVMLNSGNTALTIDSISTAAPFAVEHDCGDSLAPRASCDLGVTFTPVAEAQYSGSVTIMDDAPDSPQEISLLGIGIAAGNPDTSLSTHLIDFGNQLAGTTSAPRDVRLKSTGTVELLIDAITASEHFAQENDCESPLAPDAECTISVIFTPNVSGSFSGTLLVDDNATDSPQSVTLKGTGVAHSGPKASLSTDLINFGEVPIRTRSEPRVITLTNTGDEDLVIESIRFGGENPESFDGVNDCHSDTISPGRSCSGAVTFAPVQKGVYTASISITDNSPDSPQTIIMGGTGIHKSGGCALSGAQPAGGASSIAIFVSAAGAAAAARPWRKRRK